MISYKSNPRKGNEQMTMKPIEEMTGAELVAEYNLRYPDAPVKRFATLTEGRKRVTIVRDMMPKAKVTSVVRTSKMPTPEKRDKILDDFDFRKDSPREKLLVTLHSRFGNQRPIADLAKIVFGSSSDNAIEKTKSVSKGIPWRITTKKLKYEFRKETTKDGTETFGLHAK
jgi:hypothetical protein